MYFECICRICASEGGELHCLFEDSLGIAKMLAEMVDVKIIENDNFPQNICTNCLEKLNAAYNLKKQCQDNHIKFEEYLKNNDNKCFLENSPVHLKYEDHYPENSFDYNDVEDIKNQENLYIIHLENNSNNDANEVPEGSNEIKDVKKETFNKSSGNKKRRSTCKICNKSISKLYEHMRLHTNEKPFTCEYCSLEFSIRSNYLRHVKIHKNDRRHVCNICNRRFIVRYALVAHMVTHSKESSFKCELCENSFKTKNKLKLHISETHCNDEKTVKNIYDSEKSYLCNHCGKAFVRKINLDQHLRIHTGEKPYICRFCSKSFRSKITLSDHESTHTGDRPYTCKVCNQSFRQTAHLRQHKWRHTGVKPYKCTFCNKQFTASGSLTVHMRTHTGETPYLCAICNKGFYDSSSLKKHTKRHLLSNIKNEQEVT